MPQMNKGGKFIFGKSIVYENGCIQIPEQAMKEYNIIADQRVYLFSGSKSTGGFCVTRRGLLEPSKLGHILADQPNLRDYKIESGEFVKYKGRFYCWTDIGNRADRVDQRNDEFLTNKAQYAIIVNSQQRHSFYYGRKRPPC